MRTRRRGGTAADPFRAPGAPARRALAPYLAVAAGGMLGGLVRYLLDEAFPVSGNAFPWTLLAVNLSGSLLLPLLVVTAAERGVGGRLLRPLWGTGFLGAYTTFSTYVVAVVSLGAHGAWGTAAAYAVTSLAGGLALAFAGFALARRFVPPRRGAEHAHRG